MKPTRSIPLLVSLCLALFLLAGGLVLDVGAGQGSYRDVVVFSEVLSLVLENYVDPLEPGELLEGAYEGMLGGLDDHGAYLTAEELAEWKQGATEPCAHPGFTVLRAGRSLQIVDIEPGSPAAEAKLEVGDQIRKLEGSSTRTLSLDQAWHRICGKSGTRLRLAVFHASERFRHEELELTRQRPAARAFNLTVNEDGIGVLSIRDFRRVDPDDLLLALDDLRSRAISTILLDLRNVVDLDPRAVAATAAAFARGPLLVLKDRSGKSVEGVASEGGRETWGGSLFALVNGATAGSAEALASIVQRDLGGKVVGEPTYGLGSEPKLYELGDGTAVLLSAKIWETAAGARWNGEGVKPDEPIRGTGDDLTARQADQLRLALAYVALQQTAPPAERKAA